MSKHVFTIIYMTEMTSDCWKTWKKSGREMQQSHEATPPPPPTTMPRLIKIYHTETRQGRGGGQGSWCVAMDSRKTACRQVTSMSKHVLMIICMIELVSDCWNV